jgi:hypothetical protein
MISRWNCEFRELKAEELDEVSGGFVQIVRPAIGPAALPASLGGNGGGGTGGGGGISDGGSGGGGGGATVDYTGDPYAIHHLF